MFDLMPKPKVVYRVAKRLDCGQIEEVNEASLPVTYDRFEWENLVSNRLTFIVTISAQVAGYMACDTTGCVISFAIAEKFRRKGYGRALLEYGLSELRKTKVTKAYLRVKVSNMPAQTLYKNIGFRVVDELKDYYGQGDHAYMMEYSFTAQSQPLPIVQTSETTSDTA